MTDYYVCIIHSSTGEVVKKMGPMSERKADRVESGANINLDHENYHTEVRTDEGSDEAVPDRVQS